MIYSIDRKTWSDMTITKAKRIGSKITSLIMFVFTYILLFTKLFCKTRNERVDGVPTLVIYPLNGFEIMNISTYYQVVIILLIVLSFIGLVLFAYQLGFNKDWKIFNIIFLGVCLLVTEFLFGNFQVVGYFLFSIVTINYLQYFIFLEGKKELYKWTFIMTSVIIAVVLPSAIAVSKLAGV